jgi:DNA helicase-2/ATP-dependent DNA helicase PcrA
LDWGKKEETKPSITQLLNNSITYLSYSQIETFDICPLQYKYKYILHIPVPPSAAASFGDTIHQTMKDFYQRAIAGQKPTKDDLLKILEENWSPLGYSSKAQEKRMKKEGEKILIGFFEKSYNPKFLPKALEQIFSVKISPKLKIGGKIDRLDERENIVEIIDYKTGRAPEKKDIEKDLQLTIYSLAATDGTLQYMGILDKTPKPEQVRVSFYFFENQEKVTSVRIKEQLEEAKKQLIQKAEEISKSDFSPTPGKMCDFCDYKLLCGAWK